MLSDEKVKNLIDYWVKGSDYDFHAAKEIATSTESYVHALFFLHLSIEKALKALYVNNAKDHAPLAHSLLYLVDKNGLTIDEDQEILFSEINEFNLETRYPDENYELMKKATKEFTNKFIEDGGKVRQWLLEKLKS